MKRIFAATCALVMLSACGAVGQPTETPQQVVATASDKMSQLHSAKFDVTATVLEQFPAAFVEQLGPAGAAVANQSTDMSTEGPAKFPSPGPLTVPGRTGT